MKFKSNDIKRNYICLVRFLLFPFGMIYWCITWLRNMLFDVGILKSQQFDLPLVGVGNLRSGGTGKTPMVLYLMDLLKEKEVATLSRGYGRSTSGFREVGIHDNSKDSGDEPLLIKNLHPEKLVTVDEKRVHGVNQIIKSTPSIDVIILDDVFQHRYVQVSHMILLTSFNDLFTSDHILPVGMLREARSGARRADTIVVTKCPTDISEESKTKIKNQLSRYREQVFFAYEHYGSLKALSSNKPELTLDELEHVVLLTGIAVPKGLKAMLERELKSINHLKFGDHHEYSGKDIDKIRDAFNQLPEGKNAVITTQKDAQRLRTFYQNENFAQLPVYSIEHRMELFDSDREAFQSRIVKHVKSS